MSSNGRGTATATAAAADPVLQLRLNSAQNVRRSLCRLIRAHAAAPPDPDATAKFRACIYAFSTLAQLDKMAEAGEVAAQLRELERRLAELGR